MAEPSVDTITDELKEKVLLNLIPEKSKGVENVAEVEGTPEVATHAENKLQPPEAEEVKPDKTRIELLEERLKDEEDSLSDEALKDRHERSQQLKSEANNFYKEGLYKEAAEKYAAALNVCPLGQRKDRSILYANNAAALMGYSENKEALQDLNRALELDPEYFRALERRARLHKLLNNLDDSLADYEKLLMIKPKHCEYSTNIVELKEAIRVRNEEMKNKMMDSLKQLGNVFLKPFGLSTDSFKMNQNPDGTYSMQMNNN